MEFNFDENGNLPAGEYPISFDDLKQVFVDGFGTSYTRMRNWDGFNAFVKVLIDAGLKDLTIWVDGRALLVIKKIQMILILLF